VRGTSRTSMPLSKTLSALVDTCGMIGLQVIQASNCPAGLGQCLWHDWISSKINFLLACPNDILSKWRGLLVQNPGQVANRLIMTVQHTLLNYVACGSIICFHLFWMKLVNLCSSSLSVTLSCARSTSHSGAFSVRVDLEPVSAHRILLLQR
jgi:hypothetical protein